ncbi:MAG: glycosyltransferase family 39 protein [candidate division WOR-3 bacterium]|nr:MAG: glycosyltransferase family 39 protein [candidate division WOR-3 bacterium]
MPRPTTSSQQTLKPGLRPWLLPSAAAVLTFAVRLWFVLDLQTHPYAAASPYIVDSYFYHRWALDILGGSFWGSEVFLLRPLLPYLLALVYAVFGQRLVFFGIIQALMAAGSCLLLHDSTRRVFSRRAAAFAAFGFALTGILVFYTGALLHTELNVLFGLLTLWLVVSAGNKAWRWILAGASFGVLLILRPELVIILPVSGIVLWRTGQRLRNILALSAAALVVAAVVPVRNLAVAGEPVLSTGYSGLNLYYGNNPNADGTWQPLAELEQASGFSHSRLKQQARTIDSRTVSWSEASRYWTGKALGFVASRPFAFLELTVRKLMLFWSNYEIPNNYYPETVGSLPLRLAFVNFALAAGFGLAGMVLAWPIRSKVWLVYVFIGGYMLSPLAFCVLSRLRAPVIPFLLAFGGFAGSRLLDYARKRAWPRLAGSLAIAAAVYVVSSLVSVDRSTYSSQAWTQIGNILLGRKEVRPAMAALHRALDTDPDNLSARYSLILVLAGMGRTRDAVAEYRRMGATRNPGIPGHLLKSLAAARIAVARHDFPHAARLYSSVVSRDPHNAENHYLLGLVYVSMDSLAQARLSLQQAVGLDPGHQSAIEALQAVERKLSRDAHTDRP